MLVNFTVAACDTKQSILKWSPLLHSCLTLRKRCLWTSMPWCQFLEGGLGLSSTEYEDAGKIVSTPKGVKIYYHFIIHAQ